MLPEKLSSIEERERSVGMDPLQIQISGTKNELCNHFGYYGMYVCRELFWGERGDTWHHCKVLVAAFMQGARMHSVEHVHFLLTSHNSSLLKLCLPLFCLGRGGLQAQWPIKPRLAIL